MTSISDPDSDRLKVEKLLWHASWQDDVKISFEGRLDIAMNANIKSIML